MASKDNYIGHLTQFRPILTRSARRFRDGIMVKWCDGIIVQWYDGIIVQGCDGIIVQWCDGIIVQ